MAGSTARAYGVLVENWSPVVVAGDFSIIPCDCDVYKPERWRDDALFASEIRARFHRLIEHGRTDALRTLHPKQSIYKFCDYYRNAYAREAGLRIDHLLLSPSVPGRLIDGAVDSHVRRREKTSDHAPAWIDSPPTARNRNLI